MLFGFFNLISNFPEVVVSQRINQSLIYCCWIKQCSIVLSFNCKTIKKLSFANVLIKYYSKYTTNSVITFYRKKHKLLLKQTDFCVAWSAIPYHPVPLKMKRGGGSLGEEGGRIWGTGDGSFLRTYGKCDKK